jgi:cysteine sulfinate desulfinase/cysteine desulfurase-like protein
MNRNTDVSRLRPTSSQESVETGTRPSSCAAALERATLLLVHSMQEADTPISELSAALALMAQTLSDPAADLHELRDTFARNIAVCIVSLQSYDRLTQQLSQARDILTGLAADKLLARVANVGDREGTIELF